MMTSPVASRGRALLSPVVMSMTVVVLLVGFCPYVSSSPTPASYEQSNQVNYHRSNGLLLDAMGAPVDGDSPYFSSSVHQASAGSPPSWYVQPRAHANQFLMSSLDENQLVVPKQFTRFNDGDLDDDADDYMPSHKRSAASGGSAFSNIHKRKQQAKPPMEVMNEIVNSIYLKR